MRRKRMSSAVSLAALFCAGRLVKGTPTVTTLASFANAVDPSYGLIQDAAGNLYGTTYQSGSSSGGTAFELSAANHQTFTTLFSFNTSSGEQPYGGLIEDSAGNFYGTTVYSGPNYGGSVYEIPAANRNTAVPLFTFNYSTSSVSGANPMGGLVMDASGNLYGTTSMGGTGYGTVFELSGANHSSYSLVADFNSSSGSRPGGLVMDTAGNLYGTTYYGGSSNSGTVFRVSATSHVLTPLVSFNGSDGSGCYQTLTFGPDGYLYGTSSGGGDLGYGTVFRLSGPNYQTVTRLHSFNGTDGSNPNSPVVFDAVGNLFASTVGGITNGNVFELSGTNYQTFTTVATLTSANSQPTGPLLNDSNGVLYGTASGEMSGTNGSAFQVSGSGFVPFQPALNISAGTTFHLLDTGAPVVAYQSIYLNLNSVLVIDPPASGRGHRTAKVSDVHFSMGSSANIMTGSLDVDNVTTTTSSASSGNLSTATSTVAMGYNGGAWNGTSGFVSSLAAADTTHLTAVGVIQNDQSGTALYSSMNPFDGDVPTPDAILYKYTYYGDANLDGIVDGSDYSLVDAGFLSHGALTGWYYGDFNYDGVVNASDYTLMDNAFNRQGVALSATTAQTTQLIGDAATTVPEPAWPLAMAAAALTALARPKRPRDRFPHPPAR